MPFHTNSAYGWMQYTPPTAPYNRDDHAEYTKKMIVAQNLWYCTELSEPKSYLKIQWYEYTLLKKYVGVSPADFSNTQSKFSLKRSQ